jgi:hypothetical protein
MLKLYPVWFLSSGQPLYFGQEMVMTSPAAWSPPGAVTACGAGGAGTSGISA